jgi:hypothetical protein
MIILTLYHIVKFFFSVSILSLPSGSIMLRNAVCLNSAIHIPSKRSKPAYSVG